MSNVRKLVMCQTLGLAGIAAGAIYFILLFAFPDWQWGAPYLRSVLVCSGAMVAFFAGVLLQVKGKFVDSWLLQLTGCALFPLAIFDIFYAVHLLNEQTTLFRVIADSICSISLLFLIFIPETERLLRNRVLPLIVIFASIACGIFLSLNIELISYLTYQRNNFILVVSTFNCISFIAVASFLLYKFYLSEKLEFHMTSGVFLFLGLSSLRYGELWGINWWYTFLLRELTYISLIAYILLWYKELLTNSLLGNAKYEKLEQESKGKKGLEYLIFTNAHEAIILFNSEDIILDCNIASEKVFGWKHLDMISKKFSETIIPLQFRDGYKEQIKNYLLTKSDNKLINNKNEVMLAHNDGHLFLAELKINVASIKDEITFYAYVKDISKHKKIEQELAENKLRYRLLGEEMTDLVSICDSEGTYVYVSPSFEKLLGYKYEDLVGHSAYDFFHPEDLNKEQKTFSKLIDSNDVCAISTRYRSKDDKYVKINSQMRCICDTRTGYLKRVISISKIESENGFNLHTFSRLNKVESE